MTLLDLPNETILQIFTLLDDGYVRPFKSENDARTAPSPLLPLSLVCRRLSPFAESCLYRRLRLEVPVKERRTSRDHHVQSRFDQMCKSLGENPHRYNYLESLQLVVKGSSLSNEENRDCLLALLKGCPDEIQVHLECDRNLFGDADLLQMLETKRTFSMAIDDLRVEALTQLASFRELRSLLLNNINADRKTGRSKQWWEQYEIPVDQRRQLPIVHLGVDFDQYHPCSVLPVLQWIASLKSLDLTVSYTGQCQRGFIAYRDLQRIIDVHSATLESITLGEYSGILMDFRHFTKLCELCIPHARMFQGPQFVAAQLAAPLLKRLLVDFKMSIPTGLNNAGDFHYSCLEGFMTERRSLMVSDSLELIELFNLPFRSDEGDEFWKKIPTISEHVQIVLSTNDIKK